MAISDQTQRIGLAVALLNFVSDADLSFFSRM